MKKNYDKIQNWNDKLANDIAVIIGKKDGQTVSMYNIRNEEGKQKTPKDQAYEIKTYQFKILDYIKRTPVNVIKTNLDMNFSVLCDECKKVFPWGEACDDDLYNFIWCEMVSECIREVVP